MRAETQEQYIISLRAGQKYCKSCVSRGEYPYPLVLDEMISESQTAGQQELGLIQIPMEQIVGTKSSGRISAFSGNFMPLLNPDTEFAAKWMNLCDIHLSEEGIRDPILCYEYMGRFYVSEGNKRVSVLKSFHSPTIPAIVTRILPLYSDDPEIHLYYEFLWFYQRSGQYGVFFTRSGLYEKLQALLGFSEDHIWSEDERKSFRAGFVRFQEAFRGIQKQGDTITAGDALLEWLQVYSFSQIKDLSYQDLCHQLSSIWLDIVAGFDKDPIELNTIQEDKDKGIFNRLIGIVHSDHLKAAFIYAFPPENSAWTKAQDDGRKYLESVLKEQIQVSTYEAKSQDYDQAISKAVSDGADLIFATTPSMIGACRRAAAVNPKLKILNCALCQPYTGVRMYYSRLYECKYITGAVAGAMAENNEIGYVCNYPIIGVPSSVNAFALGARMTNPRVKIRLDWSCISGDPVHRLLERGVSVISNRDAGSKSQMSNSFEIGTYLIQNDRTFFPLAAPVWNWGKLYERIVRSVFSGAWEEISQSKAIHYWWGMDSGLLDISLSESLPDGVRHLANILKEGIMDGTLNPFSTSMKDQNGQVRNDGTKVFNPEEIMEMDWLLDCIDGSIPSYDELIPVSRELVRLLGLYRKDIHPLNEEIQL